MKRDISPWTQSHTTSSECWIFVWTSTRFVSLAPLKMAGGSGEDGCRGIEMPIVPYDGCLLNAPLPRSSRSLAEELHHVYLYPKEVLSSAGTHFDVFIWLRVSVSGDVHIRMAQVVCPCAETARGSDVLIDCTEILSVHDVNCMDSPEEKRVHEMDARSLQCEVCIERWEWHIQLYCLPYEYL